MALCSSPILCSFGKIEFNMPQFTPFNPSVLCLTKIYLLAFITSINLFPVIALLFEVKNEGGAGCPLYSSAINLLIIAPSVLKKAGGVALMIPQNPSHNGCENN